MLNSLDCSSWPEFRRSTACQFLCIFFGLLSSLSCHVLSPYYWAKAYRIGWTHGVTVDTGCDTGCRSGSEDNNNNDTVSSSWSSIRLDTLIGLVLVLASVAFFCDLFRVLMARLKTTRRRRLSEAPLTTSEVDRYTAHIYRHRNPFPGACLQPSLLLVTCFSNDRSPPPPPLSLLPALPCSFLI